MPLTVDPTMHDAPRRAHSFLGFGLAMLLLGAGVGQEPVEPQTGEPSGPAPHATALGTQAHFDEVMKSTYCARCHPAIWAEHAENTHGRAFVDPEARIATRNMARADCVRCHTPRPITQTGIGRTPIARKHNLDEGNTCMTCHFSPDYDYRKFTGGPECRVAFSAEAENVKGCVSCHRIAGTPEQWSRAENGKQRGRTCMTCHMPTVVRPVAVGQKPRHVRSHLFAAGDNETMIRRAYTWDARIDGNEVVVSISNSGAGHNFNTANAQRSVQSLVIVSDAQGKEQYRSRLLFGHGVAKPGLIEHQVLTMPANSQIPSGATRKHRVPLKLASGTVECRLYFKRYHPAADTDPELSFLLEDRKLVFDDVTPSDQPVVTEGSGPPTANPPPPATPAQAADVYGLVKFAYPAPGTKTVKIPEGSSPADIDQLIALFEYPVPFAKVAAVRRLTEIGAPAIPKLVTALGSWDNESFNRAMTVLEKIGEPAVPALEAALSSHELYVRHHARRVLARLGFPGDRDAVRQKLVTGLTMSNPVDRWSSAVALADFADPTTKRDLLAVLDDRDWDVVTAAATSLARLGAEDAIPAIRAALSRAPWPESRKDLAVALAALGSADGVPALIDGLSNRDPVLRESFFTALFAWTGIYEGYDPWASDFERRRGYRKVVTRWLAQGGKHMLRRPELPDRDTDERAWLLVEELGGGTDTRPGGDDAKLRQELLEIGDLALPALIRGLSGFPPGFARKRALIIATLGNLGNSDAAPYLAWTLDDPVLAVAGWAAWALEASGTPAAVPALNRYEARVRDLAANGEIPPVDRPASRLLAQSVRTRLILGDATAEDLLVGYLLSDDIATRRIAIAGLEKEIGHTYGYDPDASLKERRAAYTRWQQRK